MLSEQRCRMSGLMFSPVSAEDAKTVSKSVAIYRLHVAVSLTTFGLSPSVCPTASLKVGSKEINVVDKVNRRSHASPAICPKFVTLISKFKPLRHCFDGFLSACYMSPPTDVRSIQQYVMCRISYCKFSFYFTTTTKNARS